MGSLDEPHAKRRHPGISAPAAHSCRGAGQRLFRFIIGLIAAVVATHAVAQDGSPLEADADVAETTPAAPVQVRSVIADEAIANRLLRIFDATGWYIDPAVRVDEGIVFIRGRVSRESHREWAGNVANSTEGVVAVVNRIEVVQRSMWDLSETWSIIGSLLRETIRRGPLVFLGLVVLVLSALLAVAVSRLAQSIFRQRLRNALLRSVAAKILAVTVFLLGLYLVLRIAGLERLAVTVLGGTGIAGLVIGFAFRDIAENFLASVLMSLQRPFARGDLIEVAGFQGLVQQLNARSTLLMTLEGNYVQIPNATIYNNPIVNFTANPRVRGDFVVGIGYEESIGEAQELGLKLLEAHEAVLTDPEPLVLAEALGPSSVDLHFYFWVDSRRHSVVKVKSALLRRVKRGYQDAEIAMPDPNREVVFPEPVRIRQIPEEAERRPPRPRAPAAERAAAVDEAEAGPSEGRLSNEADSINEQARHSRAPEQGIDLLDD